MGHVCGRYILEGQWQYYLDGAFELHEAHEKQLVRPFVLYSERDIRNEIVFALYSSWKPVTIRWEYVSVVFYDLRSHINGRNLDLPDPFCLLSHAL